MWHSKINRPRAATADTALPFQLRPQLFGMSQAPPPWSRGPLPPSLAVDSCWFHAIFMNASGRSDALFGPWLVLLRLLALLPFGRQFAVLCCAAAACGRRKSVSRATEPGRVSFFLSIQLPRARSAAVDAAAAAAVDNNAAFCRAASPKRCMPQLTLRLFLAHSLTFSFSLFLHIFQMCLWIFAIDRKLIVVLNLIVSQWVEERNSNIWTKNACYI